MEKNYLIKVEEKFYNKLKDDTDAGKIMQRYQLFWEWLLKQDEDRFEVSKTKYRLMRSIQKQIYQYNINCKEHSTYWNPMLVKKVGEFCYKFREKWRNQSYYFSGDKPMQVMYGILLGELINEKDFATVAYCSSIFKNTKLLTEWN